MSTEWVVTTVADRVALNPERQGETTFTVTNPTPSQDQAVFEVVAGGGADASWFSVDQPQRHVQGSTSVSYLVKAAVPAQAPPGEYSLQGRVYSAESAPEETSVLSSRVMLEVKPGAPAKRARRAWWPLAVAGAVAVVLIVVAIVASASRGGPPATVAVPNVGPLTADQAKTALEGAGLVFVLKHRFADKPGPLTQSLPPGAQVARGSTVEVVAPAMVTYPTPTAPANGSTVRAGNLPTFSWTQPEPYVSSWLIEMGLTTCYYGDKYQPLCGSLPADDQVARAPSITPTIRLTFRPDSTTTGIFHNGSVFWRVFPVDDFGNRGPSSSYFVLQVNP